MENNMEPEIFNKEISKCQELSRRNKGKCNWGECSKCGVIPLLYKLGRSKIVEEESEIRELKKAILQ